MGPPWVPGQSPQVQRPSRAPTPFPSRKRSIGSIGQGTLPVLIPGKNASLKTVGPSYARLCALRVLGLRVTLVGLKEATGQKRTCLPSLLALWQTTLSSCITLTRFCTIHGRGHLHFCDTKSGHPNYNDWGLFWNHRKWPPSPQNEQAPKDAVRDALLGRPSHRFAMHQFGQARGAEGRSCSQKPVPGVPQPLGGPINRRLAATTPAPPPPRQHLSHVKATEKCQKM